MKVEDRVWTYNKMLTNTSIHEFNKDLSIMVKDGWYAEKVQMNETGHYWAWMTKTSWPSERE